MSPDEQEEKARLISQVLELQNTLDGRLHLIFYLKVFSIIRRGQFFKNLGSFSTHRYFVYT